MLEQNTFLLICQRLVTFDYTDQLASIQHILKLIFFPPSFSHTHARIDFLCVESMTSEQILAIF